MEATMRRLLTLMAALAGLALVFGALSDRDAVSAQEQEMGHFAILGEKDN